MVELLHIRTSVYIYICTSRLGILSIKEQKGRETREQLKSCKTREIAYISADMYTNGHLISNSVTAKNL